MLLVVIKNCILFSYSLPAINWLRWKYRVILMLIIVTRRYIEPLRFAVWIFIQQTFMSSFVFIVIIKIFTYCDLKLHFLNDKKERPFYKINFPSRFSIHISNLSTIFGNKDLDAKTCAHTGYFEVFTIYSNIF